MDFLSRKVDVSIKELYIPFKTWLVVIVSQLQNPLIQAGYSYGCSLHSGMHIQVASWLGGSMAH